MMGENTLQGEMQRKYLPFEPSSRLLYSGRETKAYHRGAERKTILWELRRTLLSDIQFLTFFAQTGKGNVIYLNPYPALHLELLSKFFPDLTFHCYEAKESPISTSERIIKHAKEFNDDDLPDYANSSNLYLIALTPPKKGVDLKQEEQEAWQHLKRVEEWVKKLDPTAASISFRLPYPQYWSPPKVEDPLRPLTVEYLKGYPFFEPWTGYSSTEVRLVPLREKGKYITIEWDLKDYDEMLAYHNMVERNENSYLNVVSKSEEPIATPELLSDFDSVYEGYILQQYIHRFTKREAQLVEIATLSRTITEELVRLRPLNPNEYQGTDRKMNSLAELRQSSLHTTALLSATISRPTSTERGPLSRPTSVEKSPLSLPPAVLTTVPEGEPIVTSVPLQPSPSVALVPAEPPPSEKKLKPIVTPKIVMTKPITPVTTPITPVTTPITPVKPVGIKPVIIPKPVVPAATPSASKPPTITPIKLSRPTLVRKPLNQQ